MYDWYDISLKFYADAKVCQNVFAGKTFLLHVMERDIEFQNFFLTRDLSHSQSTVAKHVYFRLPEIMH